MSSYQSAGGGFRNSYNTVIGKVNDGMSGALECPMKSHQAEKQNQLQDWSESLRRGEKVKPRAQSLSKEIFSGFQLQP